MCCAGSRLLVQESIAEEFVERLKDRVETLRVGDPMDKNTDVGAINSAAPAEADHRPDGAGVAEGAEVWSSSCPLPEDGYYVAPTIFTDATPSMRIAREEIFGPVLTTMTFRTPGRGGAQGQQQPRTGCRLASGRRRGRGRWGWPRRCGPG